MRKIYPFFVLIICSFFTYVEATYNEFETNPNISAEAREMMRPYLLPFDHPIRSKLDKLFKKGTVTKNAKNFLKSGFVMRHAQPRSFIRIAGHEDLEGYLIKLQLDDEVREKYDHPIWWWFTKRCEGARKIDKVIKENRITNFSVAQKWIYPLPVNRLISPKILEIRKPVILVVQDMEVLSTEETLKAWRKKITPAHLDELYKIISIAGGRSYRPDNIPYTKNRNFAFVDTEYPDHPGTYKEVERALSSKLKPYWQTLINKGQQ